MKIIKPLLIIAAIIFFYFLFLTLVVYGIYEYSFRNRIYPGIFIANTHAGNWTKEEVKKYLAEKSTKLAKIPLTFSFEDKKWPAKTADFDWSYDLNSLTDKAYLTGRTNNFWPDLKTKWYAYNNGIYLTPEYQLNKTTLSGFLKKIATQIDIPPEEGLFEFKDGRVSAFKLPKDGRKLNINKTIILVIEKLTNSPDSLDILLPVETVKPKVTIQELDKLNIKELIGQGVSFFKDSIPSRVHNLALAALRLHGVLIPPGETFSFNKTVGKITAETGYQKAYVITEGKTVLGDGGGVCQVSTTLYRAALYTGLPIVSRTAHTYRVGYYEPPVGLDATVFDPEPDFKFKNDTPGSILIQTLVDYQNQSLTFNFYGAGDGRKVIIDQPVILSQTKPPDPTYQDDPALPKGEIKQIDTAHWGAKVYFKRKVERNNQILIEETILSNYIPWAAVYLRGTKE